MTDCKTMKTGYDLFQNKKKWHKRINAMTDLSQLTISVQNNSGNNPPLLPPKISEAIKYLKDKSMTNYKTMKTVYDLFQNKKKTAQKNECYDRFEPININKTPIKNIYVSMMIKNLIIKFYLFDFILKYCFYDCGKK